MSDEKLASLAVEAMLWSTLAYILVLIGDATGILPALAAALAIP